MSSLEAIDSSETDSGQSGNTGGSGAFDCTDVNGYSYRVEYEICPEMSIDTSEGKPGTVGLRMDFAGCSVVVTNTTEGKKAPGVSFMCFPLYSVESFGEITENLLEDIPTFGKVTEPVVRDGNNRGSSVEHDNTYFNPFSFMNRGNNEVFGDYDATRFFAGLIEDNYGSQWLSSNYELGIGESKKLNVAAGENGPAETECEIVLDVAEEYATFFMNQIAGWGVCLDSEYQSGSIVFAGDRDSVCINGTELLYDPIIADA